MNIDDCVLTKIEHFAIIPVAIISDSESALPLADALSNGGLPIAEITFRTAAAEQSIRNIATRFPDFLIGAGTVSSTEEADAAINAGARFVVAPGLNPTVVDHVRKRRVLMIPGVCTPTDIECALNMGLSVLKFFPSGACGGLAMLNALAGPYGHKVKFIPTGGIDADNLSEYVAHRAVLACGGSWLISNKLIEEAKFEEITELAAEARQLVLRAREQIQ